MPDYSKGKIYMVFSPSTNLKYIGSTTLTLKTRFNKHKNRFDCSSKVIIQAGDAEIILLHDFVCDSLDELETEEGRVGDLYPDKVNIREVGKSKRQLMDIKNKKRREDQERKNKQAERRRNRTDEQREKERLQGRVENRTEEQNNHRREMDRKRYKNMTQEERDKLKKKIEIERLKKERRLQRIL